MTALAVIPDLLGTSPADLLVDTERHDSTVEEARQRANRLRAGIVRYSEMRQDIADAFAARDWLALGYNNWADYVDAEFGEQLAQLARGERRQAVQDLRSQGLSTRRIASVTGASRNTIAKQVAHIEPPEKVTGSDGKTYSAIRPVPQAPEPAGPASTASPAGSGTTPGAAATPPAAAPEPPVTPAPAAEPPPGSPATWGPAEVEANRLEVERKRMIEAARRHARTIVTTIRAEISTVTAGVELGEHGLVTAQMVADIRESVEFLARFVEAPA